MGNTLTVEVLDTAQDLLKAALDFTWAHAALLDSRIQVATGTKLHDLAPLMVFILDKVDGLDDVDVMQSGGNTEFGSMLFHVFLC